MLHLFLVHIKSWILFMHIKACFMLISFVHLVHFLSQMPMIPIVDKQERRVSSNLYRCRHQIKIP